MKDKFYGVFTDAMGVVVVGPDRRSADGAEAAAQKLKGAGSTDVVVFPAESKSEARAAYQEEFGSALVEPTPEELARAAQPAGRGDWWVGGLDTAGDSVVFEDPFTSSDDAWEMREILESAVVEGSHMVVQADDAYGAREVIDAQGGVIPSGPIARSGRRRAAQPAPEPIHDEEMQKLISDCPEGSVPYVLSKTGCVYLPDARVRGGAADVLYASDGDLFSDGSVKPGLVGVRGVTATWVPNVTLRRVENLPQPAAA